MLSRAWSIQIRSEAALLPFLIHFPRKSKDYKLFNGPCWYKPTDVAVKPETVKPEGSSLSSGWIKLLLVRWLLVCGSMSDTPYLILGLLLSSFSFVFSREGNSSNPVKEQTKLAKNEPKSRPPHYGMNLN